MEKIYADKGELEKGFHYYRFVRTVLTGHDLEHLKSQYSGNCEFKVSWVTQKLPGQLGIYSKTISQRKERRDRGTQ